MASTAVFVSVHTSNLANAQFLQPGSAVVELIQRNWIWHNLDRSFQAGLRSSVDHCHAHWSYEACFSGGCCSNATYQEGWALKRFLHIAGSYPAAATHLSSPAVFLRASVPGVRQCRRCSFMRPRNLRQVCNARKVAAGLCELLGAGADRGDGGHSPLCLARPLSESDGLHR